MMGTNGFADEVEAVVGCWARQCCVKVLELAGSEFSVRARGERIVVPVESLTKYRISRQPYSHLSDLRGGPCRRRQSPRKVFRR